MLEIVKNRPWSVQHTIYDSGNPQLGTLSDPSDMTDVSAAFCQISKVSRAPNVAPEAVATPAVVFSGSTDAILTLSLTEADVKAIPEGVYQIDLYVIYNDGSREVLLEPEPVRVTYHPTNL